MGTTLKKKMGSLSAERRARVEARTTELIDEEMTLRELRKARKLTQNRMAELLGIGQDSVSRIEKRSDLHLSTLSTFIEAMGGRLHLTVQFPNRPPLTLKGFSEMEPEKTKPRQGKTQKRRTAHQKT